MTLRQSLIATLMFLALGLPTGVRAELWWDANGGDPGGSDTDTAAGTWGVDEFWSSDMDGNAATGPWIADETAVFSAGNNVTGTYTVTVSGTQSTSGINFEEGTVTLNGGTVTLTNAATVNTADGLTATIGSTLGGAAGMIKSGGGTLVLNSTGNNYTGNTMLATNTNLGTFNILMLGASEVIPDTSVLQIEGQNSRILLNGKTETVRSIATINAGAGALTNSALDIGTGTLIINDEVGQVELFQANMFSSATGKIIKNGPGQINFNGSNAAWDGEVVLNEGTLGIGVNNTFGTGGSSARLTLNGGTLTNYTGGLNGLQIPRVDITNSFTALVFNNNNMQLLGTGAGGIGNVAITLKVDNPTITVSNVTGTGTFILNGPIGDEGAVGGRGFTKAGAGTLTLAHPFNTFAGPVTILEGRLTVNANGGVGNGTGAINFSGGELSVSQAGRTLAIANPLNVNTANSNIITTANGANPVLEFSSATISGAGSLRIAHQGTACGTPVAGTNTCIFDATFSNDGLSVAVPLEIDTGTTFGNGNTAVARLNSGNTSGTQTYSAEISGDGRFRRSAAGGITVLTAANTYTGGTEVDAGTLSVSGASATLGTGDVTVTGGILDITSGVANAIADTATLSISGTGMVSLGVGINDVLAGLVLGGVAQTNSGTYGSMASGADFQFDQWFSGMGVVELAAAGLAGDFNEDGKVDAADYITWRKNGPANNPLPNDSGVGTQAERYDLWVTNYGAMSGSGSGAAAAVPEPASLVLLMLAAGPALIRACRRWRGPR